jgi:quinol monooxygenase YgiN
MTLQPTIRSQRIPGTPVVLTIRLIARRPEIQRELEGLVEPVRAQPGCRHCAVMHDAKEPGEVTLVQEWATRADLDRHLRSEECRRLLALVEFGDAPPEVHIDSVAVREGLEAIAAARGYVSDNDSSNTQPAS